MYNVSPCKRKNLFPAYKGNKLLSPRVLVQYFPIYEGKKLLQTRVHFFPVYKGKICCQHVYNLFLYIMERICCQHVYNISPYIREIHCCKNVSLQLFLALIRTRLLYKKRRSVQHSCTQSNFYLFTRKDSVSNMFIYIYFTVLWKIRDDWI